MLTTPHDVLRERYASRLIDGRVRSTRRIRGLSADERIQIAELVKVIREVSAENSHGEPIRFMGATAGEVQRFTTRKQTL